MACEDLATKEDIREIRKQLRFLQDNMNRGFKSLEDNTREWKGKQQKYNDAVFEIQKVAKEWKGKEKKYNDNVYEIVQTLRRMSKPNFWKDLINNGLIIAAIIALLKGLTIRPEFKFLIDKLIGELNLNIKFEKLFDKLFDSLIDDIKLELNIKGLELNLKNDFNLKINSVLAAIAALNLQGNINTVLAAIANIDVDFDIQAEVNTILAAIANIDFNVNFGAVLNAIANINFDAQFNSILAAIADIDFDVDLTAVLSAIGNLNFDVEFTAVLAAINSIEFNGIIEAIANIDIELDNLIGINNDIKIIVEGIEDEVTPQISLEQFNCNDPAQIVLGANPPPVIVTSIGGAINELNNQIIEVQKQLCELDCPPIAIAGTPEDETTTSGLTLLLHMVDLEVFPKRKKTDAIVTFQIPNAKSDYDWCRDFNDIRLNRGKTFNRIKFKGFRSARAVWTIDRDSADTFFNQIIGLSNSEEENRYYSQRKIFSRQPREHTVRVYRAYLIEVDAVSSTRTVISCYKPTSCN
jgi:hypothetical protein